MWCGDTSRTPQLYIPKKIYNCRKKTHTCTFSFLEAGKKWASVKSCLTLTRQWRRTFLTWDPGEQYPWSEIRARRRRSDGRGDGQRAPGVSSGSWRKSGGLRGKGGTLGRCSYLQQPPPEVKQGVHEYLYRACGKWAFYLNGVNKRVTVHSVMRRQQRLTRSFSTHNLKK